MDDTFIKQVLQIIADKDIEILKEPETGLLMMTVKDSFDTDFYLGPKQRIVFASGGALNRCLCQLVGEKLVAELTVPHAPQLVGALGAALLAKRGEVQYMPTIHK
jgi:activator of 2-hydroxyglutaryl-CoA dehydratase